MATKTKPPRKPKQITSADIIAMLYGSRMTLPQMRQEALWETNSQIKAQEAALRRSALGKQQEMMRQAKAASGFASAIGAMDNADQAAIRGLYASAAGQQAGLGNAMAAGQGADQSAALAAANATVKGLTGGQAVGAPDVGKNTATTAYLGGTLPSQLLTDTGNALGFSRNTMPGGGTPSQLRLNDLANSYLAQHGSVQDALADSIRELNATRPDLVHKAMNDLRSGNTQTMAALVSALSLQNTQMGTQASIANTKTQTALDRRKLFNKEMYDRGLNPDGTVRPGFYRAPNGQVQKVPQFYKIGAGGKLVPAPYPTGTAGGGKAPTVTDVTKIKNELVNAGRSKIGLDSRFSRPQAMTQQQIANYLMQVVGQSYTGIYSQAAVDRLVQQASLQLFSELQKRTRKPKK
jgi:hypothetical protein